MVGYGLGPIARMEGRGKEASGGSFACTTGKRPRTKDDDDDEEDLGNKLALISGSVALRAPLLLSAALWVSGQKSS